MTDAGAHTPALGRRRPRWLLWALFASLALNLVVVGLVAGAMWRFRAPPPWAGAVTPNLLGYASTLSPDRRKQLWEATASERHSIRPFRRELRAARQETLKALIAEPFDRERFIAAQERHAQADRKARDAVQTLYLKIAEGLTPEERRQFPRWREHLRPPGHNLLDEPDQQAGDPAPKQ
jgi:uncharacterized membrane protein